MRTILLYLILFVLLLSPSTIHQLIKVPFLLTHLDQHQQKDQSLGLFEFLAMHYWGNDLDDDDDAQDRQLPFKTTDNHTCVALIFLLPKPLQLHNPTSKQLPYDSPVNDIFLPLPDPGSLFKPPQL